MYSNLGTSSNTNWKSHFVVQQAFQKILSVCQTFLEKILHVSGQWLQSPILLTYVIDGGAQISKKRYVQEPSIIDTIVCDGYMKFSMVSSASHILSITKQPKPRV